MPTTADQRLTKLADRAQALEGLRKSRDWEALRGVAKEMEDRTFRRLARDMMNGKEIDPVTVAKHRGFFRGMEFLLNSPDLSDRALQAALKREADTAEGDES